MDLAEHREAQAEAHEAADNGHGDALAMWTCALAARPELAELDSEIARFLSEDAAVIRESAIGAMRLADGNRDQRAASELHVLFGEIAIKADEVAAVLRREVEK